MNILEALKQQRNDIKQWTKNNLNVLNDKVEAMKDELIEYIDGELASIEVDCVKTNQGAANVGKILVVGTDGKFVLTDMPQGGATGDIIGTVDASNNILLTGALADGTYTLKYENADGTYTEVGTLEVGAIVTYTITSNLTNVTSNNSMTSVIEGESFTTTLTANDGYEISNVVVEMGGLDITIDAYIGGTISIANVTGNVVITATAVKTGTSTTDNLALPDENASGETAWKSGGWCNNSYMAGTSYEYRAAKDGSVTTNTIAVKYRDIIYVKGIKYSTGSKTQLAIFDADGSYIKHASLYNMATSQNYIDDLTATDGNDYWHFTNTLGAGGADNGVRFIRIAGVPSGSIKDIIITRNKQIE